MSWLSCSLKRMARFLPESGCYPSERFSLASLVTPAAAAALMKASPTSPKSQMARSASVRGRGWRRGGRRRPAVVLVLYRRLTGGDQVVGGHHLAEVQERTSVPSTWTCTVGPTSLSGTE